MNSNEINHRNTLHSLLYIWGQDIFEDDYLTRTGGEKKKKDKSIFGPYKIRGNQMVAGFHFSPLPTPSACVPPWLR